MTEATTYHADAHYPLDAPSDMGVAAFHEGSARTMNPFPADSTTPPTKWYHGLWNAGWDATRDLLDPAKQAAELADMDDTLRAEG